ncbi:hypothetical protein C0J52_12809, partial [Blattella germanica]
QICVVLVICLIGISQGIHLHCGNVCIPGACTDVTEEQCKEQNKSYIPRYTSCNCCSGCS